LLEATLDQFALFRNQMEIPDIDNGMRLAASKLAPLHPALHE
jgi:hypothetical protein